MALPTSTIVFALVTCVPFGLAIRDTVDDKYKLDLEAFEAESESDDGDDSDAIDDGDYEDFDSEEMDRIREQIAEDQRRIDLREAEALLEHTRALRSLYGSEVASLGRLYSGMSLGGSAVQGENEALRDRLEEYRTTHSMEISLLGDSEIHTVYIKPMYESRRELCDALGEQLRDAWGLGHSGEDRRVWLNPATAQRAVFDTSSGCELRFEKYAPVASWLDRADTAVVPVWAVGQPAAKLLAQLGGRASVSAFEITWTALGVGEGSGETRITADLRKGKVVSLFVSAVASSDTQDEIIRRVNELTGKEPVLDSLTWNTSPAFEIQAGTAQLFLTVGKRPED